MPNIAKKLVVNADDYGMTHSISRGILEACGKGTVSSVSIISTTPAWEDSIDLIKNLHIDKGVHLTLNAGQPLSKTMRHSAFVNMSGGFWRTPMHNPVSYIVRSPRSRYIIYKEFKMQIDRIKSKGIQPTHIDSHFHIHAFPAIADIVLELMRAYRISYLRIPAERSFFKMFLHPVQGIISCFSKMHFAREKVNSLPLYGFSEAGRITPEVLELILSEINVDASELIVHPGYDSPDNAAYYPSPPVHCTRELDTLTSDIHAVLTKYNIKIVRRSEIFDN